MYIHSGLVQHIMLNTSLDLACIYAQTDDGTQHFTDTKFQMQYLHWFTL